MSIFERMRKSRHEQLVFCFNRPTGLRAIIAIHDTTLGASVGGTRLMAYARTRPSWTRSGSPRR